MLKITISRLWLLLALLLPNLAVAQTTPPPGWPEFMRYDLVPKWLAPAPDGNVVKQWPPDDGCASAAITVTLPPGFLIDRFGRESGNFVSPVGEPYAGRAVPYVCSRMEYTVYRMVQPLNVASCHAASWFDEPGGAVQFKLPQSVKALREAGTIEVVPNTAPSLCGGS